MYKESKYRYIDMIILEKNKHMVGNHSYNRKKIQRLYQDQVEKKRSTKSQSP